MKGVSPTRCKRIASFMEGGHVGIKVNDQIGKKIQTKWGVRQGDLLSPIMFNTAVDMLAIIINRAKSSGQIKGVISNLIEMAYPSYNMQMTQYSSWIIT
jgi:hypothetical protein